MPYRFIEVSENDPELRGRIHGSSLAGEIARNVAICYRRFDRNGLSFGEVALIQASAWMDAVLTPGVAFWPSFEQSQNSPRLIFWTSRF